VEVAQQVLAETQTATLPLVPYFDTLRWVFIAVALGGIAVTIYARLDDWRRGRRCSADLRHARRIGMGAHGAPLRRHRTRHPSVPAGPALVGRTCWASG